MLPRPPPYPRPVNTRKFPWPADAVARCKSYFDISKLQPEQEEVAKHIGQGEDCILIAGCGWGKSLVYFLPLALWNCSIVIVSPLTALMDEQKTKLQLLGIPSISIKKNTIIDKALLDQLDSGVYRAVFISPELVAGKSKDQQALMDLWQMDGWRERLQAIVIDETHCISTWGNDFRTAYGKLGTLRAKVPLHVAFVALSATLPTQILAEVKRSLLFHSNVPLYNVGNDRPNVRLEVRALPPKNPYFGLDFLLDDLRKTIIYFDSKQEAVDAHKYLYERMKKACSTDAEFLPYHALFSSEYKTSTLDDFRTNKILMIFSTEALGMGCDIGDIYRIVQFKSPSTMTISCLVQRLGRAARKAGTVGVGILLTSSRKVKDPALNDFINTKGCRRQVLNSYFGNPTSSANDELRENMDCCDFCQPIAPRPPAPALLQDVAAAAPTKEHIACAEIAIKSWREKTFERIRLKRPRGSLGPARSRVMIDDMVDKIAKNCINCLNPFSKNWLCGWRGGLKDEAELTNILVRLKIEFSPATIEVLDSKSGSKSVA